jgi:putative ABC transport system substrate-binding protein
MRRREFISLLGGVTLVFPLDVHAQPMDQVRRIGNLGAYAKNDPEDEKRREVFQEGMKQLGWIEGRNVLTEFRWYEGDSAIARVMAKGLVELQPDLILVAASQALVATESDTHTIPIVFVAVSDPVGQRLVASLARPGGNATGFSFFEPALADKMLELLKEIAPALTVVALPFNPDNHANDVFFPLLDAAAPRFGWELIRKPVRNPGEIEVAIGEVARQPGSGLLFLPDPLTVFHRELIVSLSPCLPVTVRGNPQFSCHLSPLAIIGFFLLLPNLPTPAPYQTFPTASRTCADETQALN